MRTTTTFRRTLTVAVLALAGVGAGSTLPAFGADQSGAARGGSAYRQVVVDTRGAESVTGRAAVDGLAGRLADVAARNGFTASTLERTLLHDRTLRVTSRRTVRVVSVVTHAARAGRRSVGLGGLLPMRTRGDGMDLGVVDGAAHPRRDQRLLGLGS